MTPNPKRLKAQLAVCVKKCPDETAVVNSRRESGLSSRKQICNLRKGALVDTVDFDQVS